nr:protein disulfide-isomerase TMX3-like [Labrus bergylta]
MGETGKLVVLVLVEKRPCDKSLRYKTLLEKVAADYRETYSRSFYFGFMEDSNYINGLVMDDVIVPSFVVVNLSNDGYFLPLVAVETERHLLDFLDGVLDGSVQALGGNSVYQRIRRAVHGVKTTLQPVFTQAPLLVCVLVGILLTLPAVFCYLCLKKRPTIFLLLSSYKVLFWSSYKVLFWSSSALVQLQSSALVQLQSSVLVQ